MSSPTATPGRATIEINGQTFAEGDTIRFERATLPHSRVRDYRITAITAHGIHVAERHFEYEYTTASAAHFGITHTK